MKEVEDDEAGQQQAPPPHCHGPPRGLDISSRFVAYGSCLPVHARELNGGGNVKERADQEHDPEDTEELSVAELRPACFPQKSRVGVDFFLAGKDLEIARHVSDYEED